VNLRSEVERSVKSWRVLYCIALKVTTIPIFPNLFSNLLSLSQLA
jgi:hypothetical protein